MTKFKRSMIACLERLIVWLEDPSPRRDPSADTTREDDAIDAFLKSIDLAEL